VAAAPVDTLIREPPPNLPDRRLLRYRTSLAATNSFSRRSRRTRAWSGPVEQGTVWSAVPC